MVHGETFTPPTIHKKIYHPQTHFKKHLVLKTIRGGKNCFLFSKAGLQREESIRFDSIDLSYKFDL